MKIAIIYHHEDGIYAKKLHQYLQILKNQAPQLEALVAKLVVLPKGRYFIHGLNNIDEILMQIVSDVAKSLGVSPNTLKKRQIKSVTPRTKLDEKIVPKPEPNKSARLAIAALFLLFLFGSSGAYWWWNNGDTGGIASNPKGSQIEMVDVEGGSYTMGCTSEQGEDCYKDWEKPPHTVYVPSFRMGKYEVTQAQWQAVMGSNPSYFKNCPQCPVENVTWNEVQDFIHKLNTQTGKNYRLPTEAEWEYAARGGNKSKAYKYAGSNTLEEVAWYNDNSGGKTHLVNSKTPNELGLYHMSGNVREWCQDLWHSSYEGAPTNGSVWESGKSGYRVLRGGSWRFLRENCRVSIRSHYYPDFRLNVSGFRLTHPL